MSKSTDLQKDMRVRSVMEWIMMGYLTKDIISQAKLKWVISDRQVYKYIKEAYSEFRELSKQDIENIRAKHVAVRWKLYNELESKTKPSGASVALDILDKIAKIEGVLVDRVDLTSKGKELKAQTKPQVVKTTLKLS